LALGYYFVLEAWAGQTVGKRLLSLRVLHAGGARPSARAVAIRTLLRMVDWLPLLYLAGFITMLATGKHRRRIGDLAARTAVTRAAPVRHRALALVPLAVVVLAAAGLSVYRANSAGGILAYAAYPAGGTQTYRANGVSFEYPAGWREHSIPPASGGGGQRLWSTIVGPGTQMDVIAVEAFGGSLPVATAQDIDTSGLESLVRRLFAQVGGAMQAGPEQITMAGLPGLWFRGTGTSRGSRYESTLVFAFSGTTEYFVNCQHTSAMAAAVERACGLVVASFRVS
jgi:hypothetical protein